MLRSALLAVAAAAGVIALASAEAAASERRGCPPRASYGYGPAPAYVARYHGPAGYGYRGYGWASGAVYYGPPAYVVYEPPYAHYSRPRAYFYARLGSPRWAGWGWRHW